MPRAPDSALWPSTCRMASLQCWGPEAPGAEVTVKRWVQTRLACPRVGHSPARDAVRARSAAGHRPPPPPRGPVAFGVGWRLRGRHRRRPGPSEGAPPPRTGASDLARRGPRSSRALGPGATETRRNTGPHQRGTRHALLVGRGRCLPDRDPGDGAPSTRRRAQQHGRATGLRGSGAEVFAPVPTAPTCGEAEAGRPRGPGPAHPPGTPVPWGAPHEPPH